MTLANGDDEMSERNSFLDVLVSSLFSFRLDDFVNHILPGVLIVVISSVIIGFYKEIIRFYKENRREREKAEFRRWINFVWAKDWYIDTISARNKEYIRITNRTKRRKMFVFVSLCLAIVMVVFWTNGLFL